LHNTATGAAAGIALDQIQRIFSAIRKRSEILNRGKAI
jgi:hypothetical protein